ncbi:Conserved_hypothetical protein [Hexamita inflata]|uniref:Uncharacterized protein n=1 Tax=Hexamita inflata TaxID=28002 RepID=A0AA86Q493_9EUKA|nr:Conserved hypothetical protein [Hexamita inflata]
MTSISNNQFREMEVKTFTLFVKTMRSNPDFCLSKAETIKELAKTLRIDKRTGYNILRKMRAQTQFNIQQNIKQMRESQQYQLIEPDLDQFDQILEPDYKYEPDLQKIKVKEDRLISQEGYDQLDFNIFQQLLKMKENGMVRFSKLLRTKQNVTVQHVASIRKSLMDQTLKAMKKKDESSDEYDDYSD